MVVNFHRDKIFMHFIRFLIHDNYEGSKSLNTINKCKLLELDREHNVHLVNVYPVQNLCDCIIREYFAATYVYTQQNFCTDE